MNTSEDKAVREQLENVSRVLVNNRGLMGKVAYQGFFQWLHRYAVEGMNYGVVADRVQTSGEIMALHFMSGKLANVAHSVVFDVGASVGEYSAAVLKVFGERAKIYSFEPCVDIFAQLSKNMASSSNVKTFDLALGEKQKSAVLYGVTSSSGLEIHKENVHGKELGFSQEVNFVSLDEFCQQEKIPHIHLLKLDVEGCELSVLNGASAMLENDAIDFIQFEFNHPNIYSHVFFHDFFELLSPKYSVTRILQDGFCEITKYSESCEIFANANFLAIPKRLR